MSEIMEELKKPFPADKVHWRVGKKANNGNRGLALAYIDSREVMDRLDDVVGPENWKRVHDFGPDGEILCGLAIRIKDEWITKWDGAAHTNFEAEKGGLSDSFKRAAVNWGIGRYLYNLEAKWCDLDKYGNIKNPPSLPKWALPGNGSEDKQNTSKDELIDTIRSLFKSKKHNGVVNKVVKGYLQNHDLGKDLKNVTKLDHGQLKELVSKIKQKIN